MKTSPLTDGETVVLDDQPWHTVTLWAGTEDQEGMLFMRVDDADNGIAIIGMYPEQVDWLRDHLNLWREEG